MEQIQMFSPSYEEDLLLFSRSMLKKGTQYFVLLFRYAIPFLLLDILTLGIVSTEAIGLLGTMTMAWKSSHGFTKGPDSRSCMTGNGRSPMISGACAF